MLSLTLVLGVLVVGVSGLAAANVLAPLVVISGSMEPEITTGSLILSVDVPASTLNIGDVASLPRHDGVLVTHRVTGNEQVAGDPELRSITMKGDANAVDDLDPYVQPTALVPFVVIPLAGTILAEVSNHKMELLALVSFVVGLYLVVKMIVAHSSGRAPIRKSLARTQDGEARADQ